MRVPLIYHHRATRTRDVSSIGRASHYPGAKNKKGGRHAEVWRFANETVRACRQNKGRNGDGLSGVISSSSADDCCRASRAVASSAQDIRCVPKCAHQHPTDDVYGAIRQRARKCIQRSAFRPFAGATRPTLSEWVPPRSPFAAPKLMLFTASLCFTQGIGVGVTSRVVWSEGSVYRFGPPPPLPINFCATSASKNHPKKRDGLASIGPRGRRGTFSQQERRKEVCQEDPSW